MLEEVEDEVRGPEGAELPPEMSLLFRQMRHVNGA